MVGATCFRHAPLTGVAPGSSEVVVGVHPLKCHRDATSDAFRTTQLMMAPIIRAVKAGIAQWLQRRTRD